MGAGDHTSRDDGQNGGSEPPAAERDRVKGAYALMDAMRCTLAVTVAFAHTWYLIIDDYHGQASTLASVGYFLAGYAHASVILFFVLSGYWIARSVDRRIAEGWLWSSYLIDRLARLLVVLLPALAVGGGLDAIGFYALESSTHTGATNTYVLRSDVADTLDWRVLIGNIFFLQDIAVAPFGTNGPLWSLAYEFWFYIWFPAMVVSWRRRRLSPLLLAVLLAWLAPYMLIGFACWLCGAVLFWATTERKQDDGTRQFSHPWLFVAALPFVGTLIYVRIAGLEGVEVSLAATFALFLFFLLRTDLSTPRWIEPLAAYGAKASFSLYALHFPVIAFAAALVVDTERLPADATSIALVAIVLTSVVAICAVFARHTERHTARVRSFFSGDRLGGLTERAK